MHESNNHFFWNDFLRLHARDISVIQRFIDIFLINFFYFLNFESIYPNNKNLYLSIAIFIPLFTALLNYGGLYKSYRSKSLCNILIKVIYSWLLLIFSCLLFLSLSEIYSSYPLSSIAFWSIQIFLVLFTEHFLIRAILRSGRQRGHNTRSILYWGPFTSVNKLESELNSNRWTGYRLKAWFTDEDVSFHDLSNSLYQGGIQELKYWLKSNRVDLIIFNPQGLNSNKFNLLLSIFGDTSFPVNFTLNWLDPAMNLDISYIGNHCLINLWGKDNYFLISAFKRIFDIIFSLIIIFVLTPLLLIIFISISLTTQGSVIYRQQRYGLNGKKFFIYKFRSMLVDDEGDKTNLVQVCPNDNRVTPLGKFLRSWSLDELPQLFNVLEGHMSLVGPRPHAVAHNELYRTLIPGYMQRHSFKPGITGLAQVEDLRGQTPNLSDMQKRLEADLRYQREWSLFLDISILLKTIFKFKSKMSY